MDVPGLNPAALTEEQLIEKINRCRSYASRVGHQPHLMNSVLLVLDALEAEYHERIDTKRRTEAQKSKVNTNNPDQIELGSISTPDEE